MEIDLIVVWSDMSDELLEDLGLPSEGFDEEFETITFYHIDSVRSSPESGNRCILTSGGFEYTVNESPDSVKKKIRKSKITQNFN